jgi:hypothetical protein
MAKVAMATSVRRRKFLRARFAVASASEKVALLKLSDAMMIDRGVAQGQAFNDAEKIRKSLLLPQE